MMPTTSFFAGPSCACRRFAAQRRKSGSGGSSFQKMTTGKNWFHAVMRMNSRRDGKEEGERTGIQYHQDRYW
jgi:hypothetical protein